jgi:hypothetical protein
MAPNDLSGDLIANLDPASSVSTVRGDSPRQPEDKIRRKARPQQENSGNDSPAADGSNKEVDKKEEHKIDSLA